jgi:DNA-binding beta-propeller fold protein YncE
VKRDWARVGLCILMLTSAAAGPARGAATFAFATCTDYSGPGCGSWVSLDPPLTAHACVVNLSSDPAVRWAFGKIYVVNRFGADNIQVLDPANNFQTEIEFSVGNGTNPQDIAVLAPSKAYVSLLNASYLLVVNPTNGAALDSIPLGAFADADGIPEAAKMFVYGDRVFVALQRLFNFAPTEYSLVAVIDATADTVLDVDPATPGVQAIRLTGTNPNTDFALDPTTGYLLMGDAGSYGVLDGGVDRIDPGTLRAVGFEATESVLGGDLGDVAVAENGRAYAVLDPLTFDGNATLVRYDRATGTIVNTLYTASGPNLADIEIDDRGELWACDRSLFAPGLRVFDTSTDAALAGPISTDLPPFDVVFDAAQVAGVSAPALPAPGLRLLSLGPNPSRGHWEIRYSVGDGRASPVRLEIFDARGTEVDRLTADAVGPGEHRFVWQARAGLGGGVYFFRLDRGGQSASGRFTLVR